MMNFVIVAEIRSGYQLLATLLGSNTEILCLGEAFGSDRDIRIKSLFQSPIRVIEENDCAVDYVKNVFVPYAEKTHRKAAGFKLNYVCARKDNWSALWTHMVENKWHVIHLRRENLLNRSLSEKLAVQEVNWNHEGYDSQVRLTFDELVYYYNRSLKWQDWANNMFKNNPIMNLTYEELSGNIQETCIKVQNFLGVTPKKLITPMVKQRVGGQATFIKNYRHLYSMCLRHPVFKKWLSDIPVI